MAYKAQSIARDAQGEVVGVGPVRRFGSVTVAGAMREHPGEPPDEMLADDLVYVQTVTGQPWPRSVQDRRCMQPGQAELAKLRGDWPSKRDVRAAAFAEAKLADPVGVGVALLIREGWQRESAERYLRSQQAGGDEYGIPDMATISPPQKRA